MSPRSEIPDPAKREFYAKLFQIYSTLSFDECLGSYTKIFNDVFTNEKPDIVKKYYLTEVQVIELTVDSQFQRKLTYPVTFNFANQTTRGLQYL